jgi:RNA polymerase sigma factor (sigma-70 family)
VPRPRRRPEAPLFHLESDDFVDCYRLHYPRLVRALELAGASHRVAEDVAQEAFARMLARWRRVRTGSSPAGYAYRTGFRLLQRRIDRCSDLDAGDSSSRLGRDDGGESPERWHQPGAEGLVTTRLTVVTALAAMPPRRRACAVLSLVVGLPAPEVAAAMGISEGTVRKHIEEARADLRHAL